MASNTVKFLTAFDPIDVKHVEWFKKMINMAENMGDPNAQLKMIGAINSNPLGIELSQRDALDWPHIHFVLCAQYAKAVLKGLAYIPSRNSS